MKGAARMVKTMLVIPKDEEMNDVTVVMPDLVTKMKGKGKAEGKASYRACPWPKVSGMLSII
jgi:hypothetical protein